MIHYFTPSNEDKDFCKRCGKYFSDTNLHVTDKTDPLLKTQAFFNSQILDIENVDVHIIDPENKSNEAS